MQHQNRTIQLARRIGSISFIQNCQSSSMGSKNWLSGQQTYQNCPLPFGRAKIQITDSSPQGH